MSVLLLFSGCSVNKYAPPVTGQSAEQFSVIVEKPFEEVWSSMMEFASENLFGLDHIEKDSGLITFDFSGSTPSEWITGGTWEYNPIAADHTAMDYADYLHDTYGGRLEGKANVFIRETTPGKTAVRVRARYVFSCPPNSWVFETGGSATQTVMANQLGSKAKRTMAPTHAVEQMIISAVRD